MPESRDTILPRGINGKFLFILLGSMIVLHLVIFVIYSERNSSVEFKVNRDIIARQVINFIQTVQDTAPEDQSKLVKALDLPNFRATIDNSPKWHEQFINATLWQILQEISQQSPTIQLSFKLDTERWLNIGAEIIPTSWGLQWLLLFLEITVILAILFSWWNIQRFSIPLKKFTLAAERLGVDLNTEPLPELGPRVARLAAKAINTMQARIRELIKARTQMLAAISHDLRTPITRLKLRAQYIDDDGLSFKIVKDLDEMEAMIAETLAFARDDSKHEKKVNLDLASMLAALCENFSEVGHAVDYQGPHHLVPVHGAPMALKRMFTNLIENAIKYAGVARVEILTEDEYWAICIDDDGPGIPQEQLRQVFQPFFRGEHSRSRETGGTGLGLAVARDIARTHGGNIILERRRPRGLRAKITLPKLPSR